jgi:ketosteroid isomerase-like protein
MASIPIESANVAAVHRLFGAYRARNLDAVAELFHADAVWKLAPTGMLGASAHGRDVIIMMMQRVRAETNDTYDVKPHTFGANGDEVFVRLTAVGTRRGNAFAHETVLVFRFEDGRIRTVQHFWFDHPTAVRTWT